MNVGDWVLWTSDETGESSPGQIESMESYGCSPSDCDSNCSEPRRTRYLIRLDDAQLPDESHVWAERKELVYVTSKEVADDASTRLADVGVDTATVATAMTDIAAAIWDRSMSQPRICASGDICGHSHRRGDPCGRTFWPRTESRAFPGGPTIPRPHNTRKSDPHPEPLGERRTRAWGLFVLW